MESTDEKDLNCLIQLMTVMLALSSTCYGVYAGEFCGVHLLRFHLKLEQKLLWL